MANLEHVALLRNGVDAWNHWRSLQKRLPDLSDSSLPWINLSGADLSSADLSYCDLSESNLHEADLSNASLRGSTLRSGSWGSTTA